MLIVRILTHQIRRHLLALLTLCSATLVGQDVAIDEIDKQDPIKVSGSISALNRFYFASGIEDRQENYIWTLSGRLNFSVFGVAVPLSGTITSQNSDFTQPYNRLSVRPSYKWAKAHIGYSNMTYSSYTLAGHTFLGGGLELNPKKIRFAATYGRFATAVPLDVPTNQPFVPSFDRFGYGGKIGYGDESNYIDFMYFTAEDRMDSWQSIPDSSAITPGENLVLGTAWKISKIKNLTFSGEFATSAFTTDVRDEQIAQDALFSTFGFETRASTKIRDAFKSAVSYRIGSHTVSGSYERIDPEYQTMGAYFFNNDIENITAAYATAFFKKRVSLSVNGGLQRNNLENTRESESRRTIMAGNLVYANNPFTFGLNYSNFSSDVRYVLNPSLDSLNAVVVTQSTSVFGSYVLPTSTRQLVNVNISTQSVSDDFQSADRSTENKIFTGTLTYTAKFVNDADLSIRFNYNKNDLDGMVTKRFGPGVSYKQILLKKLTTTSALNYFSADGNSTLTALINASMNLDSKHVFTLNLSYINRNIVSSEVDGVSETSRFGETITTFNYSYNF